MWRNLIFLALILQSSSALFDNLDLGLNFLNTSSLPDIGSLVGIPWLTTLLFGPPRCGPPDTCPNYPCRQNPAIVHGYCCGCASPFERIPFLCPLSTNCPLSMVKLCEDFRYIRNCCCTDGLLPPGQRIDDDDSK